MIARLDRPPLRLKGSKMTGDERHVDIIKNDWFNGEQRVAARVALNGTGKLTIHALLDGDWDLVLRRPLRSHDAPAAIDPDDSPAEYLAALHDAWQGTYFEATEPHDADKCPFAFGDRRSMKIVGTGDLTS